MKLIFLATIVALSFSAVISIDAYTGKYNGTLSCKLTFDIGVGAVNHTASASSNLIYMFSASETSNALTAGSTGATCTIATETAPAAPLPPARRNLAVSDTHTILGSSTGTCANYTTTTAVVVGTDWTSSQYGFNCTERTSASISNLECSIYFDMGSQPFDLPNPDFKGGVNLLASNQTAAHIALDGAVLAGTYTAGTGDRACENKSSATAKAFAGAAAIF